MDFSQQILIIILALVIVIILLIVFYILRKRSAKRVGDHKVSERLEKALEYLKKKGRITSKTYQEINKVSRDTAVKDLDGLEELGIVKQVGKTGRKVYYKYLFEK